MVKVMLIEDDPTMISLLGTLLEMEGYEVIKLDQFSSVLEDIKNLGPDVILMDIHLETIDGLEILSVMRKDPELKKAKVIMTSGMDKKYESIQAGAEDFLMKPYMPDELIDKVKNLIEQVN